MPRPTPTSALAVQDMSDLHRLLFDLIWSDGELDAHEAALYQQARRLSYRLARTDWNRRAQQSVANYGALSPRLIDEWTELHTDFADVAEAAAGNSNLTIAHLV